MTPHPCIDKAWITRMRDLHRPFASTHYDGCESGHPRCALILALDEIERLRNESDAAVRLLSDFPSITLLAFDDRRVELLTQLGCLVDAKQKAES